MDNPEVKTIVQDMPLSARNLPLVVTVKYLFFLLILILYIVFQFSSSLVI